MAIIGQNLSVSKSSRLHVAIIQIFFYKFEVCFIDSSKMISSSPEVLNFNWFRVLPVHCPHGGSIAWSSIIGFPHQFKLFLRRLVGFLTQIVGRRPRGWSLKWVKVWYQLGFVTYGVSNVLFKWSPIASDCDKTFKHD